MKLALYHPLSYPRAMDFGEAVSSCFSKYAKASGRACRSEYWYWFLFAFAVEMATALMDLGLGFSFEQSGPAQVISKLALFLPGLTVSIRRLHDIGKSGWWLLLGLIVGGCVVTLPSIDSMLGWIVMISMLLGTLLIFLIWMCTPGDTNTNQYGDNPLAPPSADTDHTGSGGSFM